MRYVVPSAALDAQAGLRHLIRRAPIAGSSRCWTSACRPRVTARCFCGFAVARRCATLEDVREFWNGSEVVVRSVATRCSRRCSQPVAAGKAELCRRATARAGKTGARCQSSSAAVSGSACVARRRRRQLLRLRARAAASLEPHARRGAALRTGRSAVEPGVGRRARSRCRSWRQRSQSGRARARLRARGRTAARVAEARHRRFGGGRRRLRDRWLHAQRQRRAGVRRAHHRQRQARTGRDTAARGRASR